MRGIWKQRRMAMPWYLTTFKEFSCTQMLLKMENKKQSLQVSCWLHFKYADVWYDEHATLLLNTTTIHKNGASNLYGCRLNENVQTFPTQTLYWINFHLSCACRDHGALEAHSKANTFTQVVLVTSYRLVNIFDTMFYRWWTSWDRS